MLSLLVQWFLDWQTHVQGPERESQLAAISHRPAGLAPSPEPPPTAFRVSVHRSYETRVTRPHAEGGALGYTNLLPGGGRVHTFHLCLIG